MIYRLAKRVVDIVFSAAVLLILSPLLLLVAVIIKIDSPGPVFYVGMRRGQGGRPFRFFKFRTMVRDADRKGSAMLTTASDARVTRVGRFLRLFKIDEIPQFLNVLKGDMSIVGPRPEVGEVVDGYYPERWAEVLAVKPGITCLLQVETFPDFTVAHDGVSDPHTFYVEHQLPFKLERDLDYVRRASLGLDLLIIARTAGCILLKSPALLLRSGRNAGPSTPHV